MFLIIGDWDQGRLEKLGMVHFPLSVSAKVARPDLNGIILADSS